MDLESKHLQFSAVSK